MRGVSNTYKGRPASDLEFLKQALCVCVYTKSLRYFPVPSDVLLLTSPLLQRNP